MSALLAQREGEVLVLTLNRPGKANAMNAAMQDALVAQLGAAGAQVRAVVLAASGGRVFSAGADLKEYADLDRAEASRRRRELLVRTLFALLEFPGPIIAAVQGKALGAGCMAALLADEVIMAPAAEMGLPEIAHGMPTPIGAAIVAARAGNAVARRMVQGGAAVGAAQCLALGLADAIAEDPGAAALDRARKVAAGPAYGINKRYLNAGLRAALHEAAAAAARQ